ncbi:unnamed protein product [Rhizopus stolonifer]
MLETNNSPVHTQITFSPKYQNEEGRIICSPSSVFEGTVNIIATQSIPVRRIKLVFKATERVNYHILGWEAPKDNQARLFAVRTILWGFPNDAQVPPEDYPVLEQGQHQFPFICQMPVVNFPPDFENHLIAQTFHLYVVVETLQDIILSKPTPLGFQPMIETKLSAKIEHTLLTQSINAQVSVARLEHDISEPLTIPMQVKFSATGSLSQLNVCLKKTTRLDYQSFSNTDTVTVVHYSQSKLNPSNSFLMQAPRGLTPTLDFSRHFRVEYRLVATVKVRHGPIQIKRKVLDVPIVLGTLPLGVKASRQLENYSNLVENVPDVFCKPLFLKQEFKEECLPAYDDSLPPIYPYTPYV